MGKLKCDNCDFTEDNLYMIDGQILCEDCIEKLGIIEVQTTITYYANGEFFDESEYSEAIEYVGGVKIK